MSKLQLKVGDEIVTKLKTILRGVKIGDTTDNTLEKDMVVTVTKDNIFLLSQLGHIFKTSGEESDESVPEVIVEKVEKKARAPRKPKVKADVVATDV